MTSAIDINMFASLDKYDELFEAIRQKEPEGRIRSIWNYLKPKGFFKDVFLANFSLLLDKPMVRDYTVALYKLKQELKREHDLKEECENN